MIENLSPNDNCKWYPNDEFLIEIFTDCLEYFFNSESSKMATDFNYCPYCGKKILIIIDKLHCEKLEKLHRESRYNKEGKE